MATMFLRRIGKINICIKLTKSKVLNLRTPLPNTGKHQDSRVSIFKKNKRGGILNSQNTKKYLQGAADKRKICRVILYFLSFDEDDDVDIVKK